jgi:DNA polymerase III subunit beta
MQVTLSVKELQEVMELVTRFVSRHATLPILENVYIKASVDGMLFRASDMEKYIEISLDVSIADEAAVTVHAKTLYDLLKSIDQAQVTLTIDMERDSMTLATTQDSFTVKWIPASEYVAVPQVAVDAPIRITAQSFVTWIWKVEYAVTEKNFSPVLTGIYIRTKQYHDEKKLVFVGTDSFRLAEYKTALVSWDGHDFGLIVPKVHIADIKRVLEYYVQKWGDELDMLASQNMVSFSMRLDTMRIQVTTLLIQGSFPDYDKESIMPTTFRTTAGLDKDGLDKAIKKISILTRDINNYISVVVGADGGVIIRSWQTDMGEWSTQCTAHVAWPDVTLWLNGKYVTDFLRSIVWLSVEMYINDSDKPIILKDPQDSDYTYVVRPLVK